jgi:lipoprotein NlpI
VALMLTRRPGAAAGFKGVLDIEGWKGAGELPTYSVIFGHLAARQSGDEVAAKQFLDDSVGKLAEAWPFPAVRFLRGEIDEAALLKLATDDEKQAEARCFLGLDYALKGNKDKALTHFLWVKEHGTVGNIEHTIAVAELERLERGVK